MVKTWKELSRDERQAIDREFASHEAIRMYSADGPEDAPETAAMRPTSHQLALYLQGQGNLSSEVVLPMLRRDALLRRKFDWLLSHYALVSVPSAAAAASSKAEMERPLPHGGCVRIVPSKANPKQAHLVIQLPALPGDKTPQHLFVRLNDQTYSLALPPPLDGKLMQLMSLHDPVITALCDARSQLDLV